MEKELIKGTIEGVIKANPDVKIAIYPFGKWGKEVKRVLNDLFRIQESIIVDNYLANYNPAIHSLNSVENPDEYMWILTCENPSFHKRVVASIRALVPEEKIIDIFENKQIYNNDYKLLSQTGMENQEMVSAPCEQFLDLIIKKKNEGKNIVVAEIGVGIGATAVEICKILRGGDIYYCFDLEDIIADLVFDLNQIPEICCKIIGMGNTKRACDSYTWNLSSLLFKMRNDGLNGLFDLVYLDGAHTFLHDGLACCLLKELLKPNGYIVFDDVFWKARGSKSGYEWFKDIYTEEQIDSCQVLRVINAFMINDSRFQEIYLTQSLNPSRAVFKKVSF